MIVAISTPVIAATVSGGYSSRTRSAEQLGADGGLVQIFVVLEAVAPDHVHQPRASAASVPGRGWMCQSERAAVGLR